MNRRAIWLFASVAAVVLILDLWSKYAVFGAVPPPQPYEPAQHRLLLALAWRDWVWLEPHWNTGTAWSLLASMPGLVTILTLVLLPAICWYWWRYGRSSRIASVALGGIVGGAVGNAWDRVLAQFDVPGIVGVRDFIHLDLQVIGIDYIWPTFNIADCGITGGAIVLIASQLFAGHGTACEPHPSTDEAGKPFTPEPSSHDRP